MTDQEFIEWQAHVDQMLIDHARKAQEIYYEPRKVRIAFAVMIAAIIAASAAAGSVLTAIYLTKPVQPIVIHLEK